MSEVLRGVSDSSVSESTGVPCDTVIFDESSSVNSPSLLDVIDRAESEYGITARVIIKEGITDEGYGAEPIFDDGLADIYDFTRDVTTECQWEGDSILIAVSDDLKDPNDIRSFDILKSTRTDSPYTSGPQNDNLYDTFIDDLLNEGGSYQLDAANAIELILDDVAKLESRAKTATDATNAATESISEQSEKDSGLNAGDAVLPAGGLLGVGVLALTGVNLKRRQEYGSAKRSYKKRIVGAKTEATWAAETAEETLAPFRDDDALRLRELNKDLEARTAQLFSVSDQFWSDLREQKSFWRRPERVSALYEKMLSDDIDAVNELQAATTAEFERVQGLAASLENDIAQMQQGYNTNLSMIQALNEQGYDTGYFDERLKNNTTAKERIEALKRDNFIELTDSKNSALLSEIKQFNEVLSSIPELREQLLREEEVALSQSTNSIAKLEASKELVESLKIDFHADAGATADVHLNELDESSDRLKRIASRLSATHDSKDIAVLYERESLVQEANQLDANCISLVANLEETQRAWTNARDTFDDNANHNESAIQRFESYVLKHKDDVESETADQIQKSKDLLATILQTERSDEKPQYLDLQDELLQVLQKSATLQEKAVEERNEMVTLRQTLANMPSSLDRSRNSVLTFCRTTASGDVDQSIIRSLRAIETSYSYGSSRTELRDAVAYGGQIESEIEALEKKAKQQYKDAEDAREAERQRLAKIAADAARAQAAAATATQRAAAAARQSVSRGGHTGGRF